MRIGDENRWWNRRLKLPIKGLAIALALLLVIFFGYIWFGSVIESAAWHITHGSTATHRGWPGTKYEGFSVKAPWMWRQVESLGGDPWISLVRARVGSPDDLEFAEIKLNSSSGDGLKLLDLLREQADREVSAGKVHIRMKMVDFPIDADLSAHFKCVSLTTSISKEHMPSTAQCASSDGGRWSVFYRNFWRGDERDAWAESLNTVLRTLVSQNGGSQAY